MSGSGYPGVPTPTRRGRGPLIVVLAVLAVLVLGGGGAAAFLLLRDGGGEGQPSPEAAATSFLNAVYKDKDAAKASKYVCSAARSTDDITRKINEVRRYEEKFNREPRFAVDDPKVEKRGKERADVAVTIRFSTSDDRAAEQKLSITAVKDDGWYVCDIKTVS